MACREQSTSGAIRITVISHRICGTGKIHAVTAYNNTLVDLEFCVLSLGARACAVSGDGGRSWLPAMPTGGGVTCSFTARVRLG